MKAKPVRRRFHWPANNVNVALEIAREARQIHGGMGITGEYSIMRHMMKSESVVTLRRDP